MPDKNNQHLSSLFKASPFFQEAERLAKTLTKSVYQEGSTTVQLQIPTAFLTLARFLEEKRAEQAGVSPTSLERCLETRLLNKLQDDLHWLTVDPRTFAYYRDLWNQLCDQEGMPEERLGAASPDDPF